jgi:hypothetical protein
VVCSRVQALPEPDGLLPGLRPFPPVALPEQQPKPGRRKRARSPSVLRGAWVLPRRPRDDPYASWDERAAGGKKGSESCHPPSARGLAVIKGGSDLCARSHCVRFRASARHAQEADVTTSHIGFRTVLRVTGARAALEGGSPR